MAGGKTDDLRDAELQLDLVRLTAEDRSVAAQATEALARLMIRLGELRDAVPFYEKLRDDFADVKLKDGKTGAEIYNELITDKRLLPFLSPGQQVWNQRLKGEFITGPFTNFQQANNFTFVPEGELLPLFQRYKLVMDTNMPSRNVNGMANWQLRMVDKATEETVMKEPDLYPNHYLFQNAAGSPAMRQFAQAKGHVLILTVHHMVYAFDLVARKKIWEYNLFGDSSFVTQNVMQVMQQNDGSMQLIYDNGMKVRIGQTSVVESSYVCLQDREGLVALDPLLGKKKKLWTKEMPGSASLFGDATHVFIVEMNSSGVPTSTKAVRASDGVTVPVPDFTKMFDPSKRLRIIGRDLLVFDDDDGKKALRLYDVLTGKDVWKQTFAANSVAIRSDDPTFAGVLEPNGDVTVMNLQTRKTAMKYVNASTDPAVQLGPTQLKEVQEAWLLHDRERFYVLMSRTAETGVTVTPNVVNTMPSHRLHGTIVAFDRDKASMVWKDELDNQWVVTEQFQDLPIIICASGYVRYNQANGNERQEAHVVAIDKKSGKHILHDQKIAPNGQFYGMTINAKDGYIELLRHDVKVRFAPENSTAHGPNDKPKPTGAEELPIRRPVNVQIMPIQLQAIPAQAVPVVPAQKIPPPKP
jgi:hypothetical protein